MKSMYLINAKHTPTIVRLLQETKSIDKTYEIMTGNLSLYGVAFFGHGNAYKKRKCEHLHNSIMFIAYDFKEVNILTENQKTEIANYLNLKN